MSKIFLLPQQQIIDLFEKNKITEVVIERVSVKEWYPIFLVDDQEHGRVRCSIRVGKGNEVRKWADLRLLTEFLIEKCNVDECLLKLKNTE